MKARKKVIGIFLAVVVLCLGVGFAALNDDLQIDGTVTVETADVSNAFSAYIKFANENTASGTGEGESIAAIPADTKAVIKAAANGDAADLLEITVVKGTFSAVGQVIVVTVDIENESETNDADVAITKTQANSGAETAYSNSPLNAGSFEVSIALTGTTVPKKSETGNGKITATIRIKLAKLPTDDETDTFTFKLLATAK